MEKFILPNGSEVDVISYNFVPSRGNCCICYGTLSNGEKLPLDEIKRKYRKVGLNYLEKNK